MNVAAAEAPRSDDAVLCLFEETRALREETRALLAAVGGVLTATTVGQIPYLV